MPRGIPEVLVEGLAFPEGPRWRDGWLWFSDIGRRLVARTRTDGTVETVAQMDDAPSGLGFLPDGTLLVVSMGTKRLLRLVGARTEIHAELSDVPGDFLNDMVVDAEGRAYVGTRSAALHAVVGVPDTAPDTLVVVSPDGDVAVAASGLVAPNGTVITPDGRTLVVAEIYAHRLSAYDRGPDGSLSGRRVFAELPDRFPDGIALDAQGAVWVGSPYTGEAVRVLPGGETTDRLAIPGAVACALGGPGRGTLFVLVVDTAALPAVGRAPVRPGVVQGASRPQGRILTLGVDVPGAGWP